MIFRGNLNANGVMLLFDEFLLPFINLVYPDYHQVHMDNAPTHTAHKTTLYMILNNINHFQTPPQSWMNKNESFGTQTNKNEYKWTLMNIIDH